MKRSSLRLRLTLLTFISISLALVATTYALNDRFYRYFEDRIYAELEQHLEQLATNLSLDAQNRIIVAPLLDRRFSQPFSGLYWQVQVEGEQPMSSRSLWGKPMRIRVEAAPGVKFHTNAKSPTGSPLLVSGWVIVVGEGDAQKQVLLAVAIDETEVLVAAEGFRAFLFKWLGVMMVGLLIAAWFQIHFGLAPLKLIHRKVEQVKTGAQTRLSGQFPSEVQPLVDEVNTLLQAHEASLARARAKASDLAHGLKTPLTVMRALLYEISENISLTKAKEIEAQISAMHRFIERELAQARNEPSMQNRTQVRPVIEQMVSSMKKLPRGGDLRWELDIPEKLTIPFDQHDLSELIGNVLDNARKWAGGNILITGKAAGDGAGSISIHDDGQGVPVAMMEAITSRGKRMQYSETGAGLGLAICEDLLEAIGGSIKLNQSHLGGLNVEISWP